MWVPLIEKPRLPTHHPPLVFSHWKKCLQPPPPPLTMDANLLESRFHPPKTKIKLMAVEIKELR